MFNLESITRLAGSISSNLVIAQDGIPFSAMYLQQVTTDDLIIRRLSLRFVRINWVFPKCCTEFTEFIGNFLCKNGY